MRRGVCRVRPSGSTADHPDRRGGRRAGRTEAVRSLGAVEILKADRHGAVARRDDSGHQRAGTPGVRLVLGTFDQRAVHLRALSPAVRTPLGAVPPVLVAADATPVRVDGQMEPVDS